MATDRFGEIKINPGTPSEAKELDVPLPSSDGSGQEVVLQQQEVPAPDTEVKNAPVRQPKVPQKKVAGPVRRFIVWFSILPLLVILYGVGSYSAYCAAKHGVTGFMRSCKWEVRKRGIKASTIFPMRVDTEFFNDYAKKPAKKEMLSAKDLADDIVAVASQSLFDIVKVRYTNFCKRVGAFLFNR